jgi:hypothetical protein
MVPSTTETATILRPPIDRIPPPGGGPSALVDFVRDRIRPWSGEPLDLPRPLTRGLWILLGAVLVFGGWLLGVRADLVACGGPACAVATLGHSEVLLLVLAEFSAAALVVAMPMTHGLARAGAPQLAVIAVGALCGLVAMSGVLAMLVAGAVGLMVSSAIALFIIDRF